MLVDDNVVKQVTVEPDDTGLACLLCIRTMKRKHRHEHSL